MTTNTSVGITKDASGILDVVAKQTGMSKLYLASTVITMFFDPEVNPFLTEALSSFESDRKSVEKDFMERVMKSIQGSTQ